MDVMTQFSYLKPLHGVQLFVPDTTPTYIGDVRFHLPFEQIDTLPAFGDNTAPIWQLKDEGERYTTDINLYQHANTYQLNVNCEGSGSFIFTTQAMQVYWQPAGTGFEHYIQSTAIACWLELKGVPCIHANAMSHNGDAFLFIAPSRTGKSTLTTQLLEHGFKMMTDDMAAIHQGQGNEYHIYPSWPKIRLWPDSASQLIGTKLDNKLSQAPKADDKTALGNSPSASMLAIKEHKKVHENFAKHELEVDTINGSVWHESPAPLKAIYYLERTQSTQYQCDITPLTGTKALFLLLQNSMLADAYVNLGLETQRLEWMSNLLQHIKIYKITYSSGMQHLPQISNDIKCHTLLV
jgi:hypothetical protein